jgi:hypothetical protein
MAPSERREDRGMPAGLRKRKSRSRRTDAPSPGNGAGGNGSPPSATRSFAQRAQINTWPKRIAAAVLGAVVASGVSYFIGADFWKGVEKKIGTAGAPVQVTTITDIDRFNSDVVHIPEFVVNRPISEVPPPPNGDRPEGRFAWAREMGGVDATESLFRVVIAGKEASPVVLQGLHVKVVERKPPLKGSLLSYFGIGAPQSVRYIQIDLSKDPPKWDYIGQKGEPEEHFPLRVTSSDSEVFDVQAFTLKGSVSWYLEFDYTADGEQGTIRVDDHGKPFRITEGRAPGQNFYGWLKGRWRSSDMP